MNTKLPPPTVCRTAAVILAAAVIDHIPQAYKVRGGSTPWGFYYDFVLPQPVTHEVLPLLEEKMRRLVALKDAIKMHEMMPSNAKDLLKHHRHFYGAHFVQLATTPLVQVCQIGHIVDYVDGECLTTVADLKAFKLLTIERRPDLIYRKVNKQVYRIMGVAASCKEVLKSMLRSYKQPWKCGHQAYGETLQFFSLNLTRRADHVERARVYWKGEGEACIHMLKEFWREEHQKRGFELILTHEKSIAQAHLNYYHHFGKPECHSPVCIAEMRHLEVEGDLNPLTGLLDATCTHQDLAHTFCAKKDVKQQFIVLVKLLDQIPKIFQLTSHILITAPRHYSALLTEVLHAAQLPIAIEEGPHCYIEWQLADQWGDFWRGPSLSCRSFEGGYLLQHSVYDSLERLIALVLENEKKDLSQKKEILSKIRRLDE